MQIVHAISSFCNVQVRCDEKTISNMVATCDKDGDGSAGL